MTKEDFKAMTPMEQVRILSGILVMETNVLVSHLALINLISRVDLGLADKEFLDSQLDKAFGASDENKN